MLPSSIVWEKKERSLLNYTTIIFQKLFSMEEYFYWEDSEGILWKIYSFLYFCKKEFVDSSLLKSDMLLILIQINSIYQYR